jgi:diguanylate cyclase (GGDEF)-like protein
VLLLDLDDFKGVNDSYGHLVGDQLLIEVANRFKHVTRTSDTLCRFGGDEFLYLAEGLNSHEEAQIIAERLLNALSQVFTYGQISLEQRASVGIVVWDGESPDNVELIQHADAAMYEAKRQGHGHIALFTPRMGHAAFSRFSLIQELRHALVCGDLAMHYQPIIDLTSDAIVGFEALMRWHHPERGWIPPDVFIPLAEQSDLILDLGSFALKTAMTAASTWEVTDPTAGFPYVTVNLSAHQFHDPGLVPLIQQELKRTGIEPERLILEVTESVALVDIAETLDIMEELNSLKIRIALDDFGTGYSSLSYLTALNPKIIKIDQSFVRPKHDKKRSDTLLEAIVTLGNKLNMTVLAEGIETAAQLDRLHNLDCALGQGFFWSPAVPVDEVLSMLARIPEE